MLAESPRPSLLYAVLTAAGLLAACGDPGTGLPAAPRVVEPIRLGSPFPKPAYARNVWDMQAYGGLVYLGHGNSANREPAPNAGPVDIVAYDPAVGAFVTEGRVEDEQIDRFRVLDGQLHIPGHDPRESLEWGNFYRREDGRWVKHRTLPGALHTFDLAWFQGRLFAANGTSAAPGTVQVSADGGRTWEVALAGAGCTYNLFVLGGTLYAVFTGIRNSDDPAENPLYRFDGTGFVRAGVAGRGMIPGAGPAADSVRMERAAEYRGQLLYLGATTVNGIQWEPLALYVAGAVGQARRVALPLGGAGGGEAKPYDVVVRPGAAYVLASARQTDGAYLNAVYASSDLARWRELFRFHAPTFARSFEEVDGDFYFGLGTDPAAPGEAAGDILRVPRAAYAGPV